jgi:hypothetical protein
MSRDPMGVRFDPVTHRYWAGPRELLAVTRILHDAGLVDGTWFTASSRDRGRRLHARIEAMDRGEPPCAISELIATDGPKQLEAYQRFLSDLRPVWHAIETPVADLRLGYAGTLDRAGTLQGDAVVVDVKTGAIPAWAPLQLVAYARLARDGQVCRPRRLIVHLLPTGCYSLREYPVVNFGRDERIFLSALAIAQWKRAA